MKEHKDFIEEARLLAVMIHNSASVSQFILDKIAGHLRSAYMDGVNDNIISHSARINRPRL